MSSIAGDEAVTQTAGPEMLKLLREILMELKKLNNAPPRR